IKISHQTIANYAQAASHLLFPWLDNFKHDLNAYHCGDETYVKVLGKKAYTKLLYRLIFREVYSNNLITYIFKQ
ncbi:hypothetical protein, partial [uncultured Thomasclavelia sp.]|uniref:hypothetical protein n=1 Tax=uncultured Thomasclavelia sp. TaxID=3025759 RepID=UPI0025D92918